MNKKILHLPLVLAMTLGLLACASTGGGSDPVPRTASDQTDTDRRAGVRIELAYGYFARGQYNTALDELKQALAVRPNMPEALNLRGLVYAALGEIPLAEESFRRALGVNARDPDTLHNYGWFLCQQARYPEAFVQFDQALAQPQYRGASRSLLAKGVCEASAGQLSLAEKTLARAFELDPSNPAIAVNLAEVLYRNGQYERARFYVKRVNDQAEQLNAQSLWLALRVERRLGNTATVADLGQQLRRRFPQSPELQALDNGRYDE
ncbi:type IV pilus biogenesis/stability protein PilW [Roseateles sp. DAIF2]|uniref:type IV pilus biogenesis/stability protein PilW n=1 Tax=Roseateles sp. DAIF2 TaxID=2714952 RepID=UPI0018A2B9E1|nr:type IV pilus biogenesis/stability protein PilW [Roseateles sp. DAIF2]QPF74912.1 type IV pilus biogenesis/stability protein PilW [Roseateles sp. DAIF2]